jgi:hypothetical protein
MSLPGYPLSTNLVAALTPATPAPTITIFLLILFILNIANFLFKAKLKVAHLQG